MIIRSSGLAILLLASWNPRASFSWSSVSILVWSLKYSFLPDSASALASSSAFFCSLAFFETFLSSSLRTTWPGAASRPTAFSCSLVGLGRLLKSGIVTPIPFANSWSIVQFFSLEEKIMPIGFLRITASLTAISRIAASSMSVRATYLSAFSPPFFSISSFRCCNTAAYWTLAFCDNPLGIPALATFTVVGVLVSFFSSSGFSTTGASTGGFFVFSFAIFDKCLIVNTVSWLGSF